MTDLGTLGGITSAAEGINASGQVVGHLDWHAFLYSDGSMTDLGTLPGGSDSAAFGINDSGQVVGSWHVGNAAYHAFLYSGGIMQDLGTLGGSNSYGKGINDSGQVVGSSDTAGNFTHDAFLYSNGSIIDLNSLLPPGSGWQLSSATAINDSGQIVGEGVIDGQQDAFLLNTSQTATPEPGSLALLGVGLVAVGLRRWLRPGKQSVFQLKSASHRSFALRHAGPAVIVCCLTALARPALPATITDLGTLGGYQSQAYGINASGQVVGWSYTTGRDWHAFLYSAGSLIDLGTLGGSGDPENGIYSGSDASGINDSGRIVGFAAPTGNGTDYAFLYSGGSMIDLGTLGGFMSWANGIN